MIILKESRMPKNKRNIGKEIIKSAKECLESVKEHNKLKAKGQRLYKTYGITLDDWSRIHTEQGGVCAVCKGLPGKGILCVDHIHVKGFKLMSPEEKKKYVRGLVCFMCNTSFKSFEKTVDGKRNRQMLEGTYEYFQKFHLKGEV